MANVAILIAVAAVTIVIAPFVIRYGQWHARAPRTALFVWLVLFTTGLVSIGAAVFVAVATTAGVIPHVEDGHSSFDHTVLAVIAWASLAAAGALAVIVMVRLDIIDGSARAVRDAVVECRRVSTTPSDAGSDVTVAESPRLFALAVPGPEPHIVVSRGLVDTLTSVQLDAVLEHERSHLVNRHSVILTLAEINQACVPRLAAARAFGTAMVLLVELIADDDAVRRVGPDALCGALRIMASSGESNSAALRADRIAQRFGGIRATF